MALIVRTLDGQLVPTVPTITAQPRHKWPAWATAIARFSKTQDSGVGDTAQRIAAKFGGEQFKTFAKTLGMPCGCTERQQDWNTRYPYDETEPSQS